MDDPSWEHQNPGEGITMFNQSKAAQNMGLKANGSPGPPSVKSHLLDARPYVLWTLRGRWLGNSGRQK